MGQQLKLVLLICAACGLVGLSACSSPLGKFGDPCNAYAVYPTTCPGDAGVCSGDCTAGLQCSCEVGGCFCAISCAGDGGTSCPGNTVCGLGRNAVENNSGYYCFPPQRDAGF